MAGTPKLIILSEQLRGKRFELNKERLTVGRSEERDICIKDPTVSTYHCEFIQNGNTYILRDNDSTNGTRINNVPLTGEQQLVSSDIVQVGSVEMLYDCEDEASVMRTQTGIVIDEGGEIGATTMKRIDNPEFRQAKPKAAASNWILISVVVLLALLVMALLGYVFYLMVGGNNSGEQTPGKARAAITVVESHRV